MQSKDQKPKAKDLSKKTRPDLPDTEWLAYLRCLPEYKGIDVFMLYRNMVDWCFKKSLTPTRLRLINWLNREAEAMPMTAPPPSVAPSPTRSLAESLPDCATCKNERFVSAVIDPEAKYDWAKYGMVPCPDCNADGKATR